MSLVLPILALICALGSVVVPIPVAIALTNGYTGEAAAYGIHAAMVSTICTVMCWAAGFVSLVLAIISLILRRRWMAMSISAIVVSVIAGVVSPAAYLIMTLAADVY